MINNYSNIVETFQTFFRENVLVETISFDGRTLTFKVNNHIDKAIINQTINSVFGKNNALLDNKYEIIISSCLLEDTFVFYDLDDFYNNYSKYKDNFDESLILILKESGVSILKNKAEVFTKNKAVIFNFYTYQKLLDFLKANPLFTTFLNESNNQFIIISKDNGVFHIGYRYKENRIEDLDDLQPIFEDLKVLFQKKEFIQFFKEIITNIGIHEKDIHDRFFEIIKSLKLLLSLAEKDYENYVLDFAFDKIKSKFKEERNKYFESLEKNIDTVSKQVFAFPLTFSATAFASYQVKDKPWILGLIILAYLLYTIIAFYILSMVKYNIICLKSDVLKEESEIKKAYNKIYSDFKDDFEKIWKKISKLECLICILKFILITLLFSFVVFSAIQILNPTKSSDIQTINIPTKNIQLYIRDLKNTNSIDSVKKKDLNIINDSVNRKIKDNNLKQKKDSTI